MAQAACVRYACAMRSLAIVITNFQSHSLSFIFLPSLFFLHAFNCQHFELMPWQHLIYLRPPMGASMQLVLHTRPRKQTDQSEDSKAKLYVVEVYWQSGGDIENKFLCNHQINLCSTPVFVATKFIGTNNFVR